MSVSGSLVRAPLPRWTALPLQTKGLIVIAIPLTALLLAATLFFLDLRRQEESRGLVAHSVEHRSQIQTVRGLLTDAETGVRGYLLTGRTSFLQPRVKAVRELPAALARLHDLARSPAQQAAVERVRRLSSRRLRILATLSRSSRAGGAISAHEELLMVEGKKVMDALRAELDGMQLEEERDLDINRARLDHLQAQSKLVVTASLVVGLGAGILAMILFTSGIVKRSEHLWENALRLSEELPLHPVEGDDEIGRVGRGLEEAAGLLAVRSAELREARSFLEQLIESGPVLISRADATAEPSVITYVSPNVERLLGYPPEEVVGARGFWESHIHPEDVADVVEKCGTAVSKAVEKLCYECRLKHRDGHWMWVYNEMLISYQDGAPVSYLGYTVDVTDRKTAEEQARAARDEAERSSRAKSEFLSRMSHELRTPLNAILGFAQLLEMDGLDDAQLRSVTQIITGGRHLLGLIDEVLDIARIEAGRLSLSVEPVEVDAALQEAVELIRPLAAERGVGLVEPGVTGLWAAADHQRLKQVLLNLLSNAVKYNRPRGRVYINVEPATSEYVCVSVRDTGMGLSVEQMSQLFSPFNRLGAERGEVEGTGLGLSLSKGLVEAMGGSIGVSSEPGEGSTFWIQFAQAPAQVRHSVVAQPEGSRRESRDERKVVLYVEDNRPNLRLVESILAQRPHIDLVTATEGERGLELAGACGPDLILLDLNLPDMHGSEVLKRLRSDPATSDVNVVVLSADATKSQVRRLLNEGASSYLTKPIDVKKFISLVDEELECRA